MVEIVLLSQIQAQEFGIESTESEGTREESTEAAETQWLLMLAGSSV